MPNSGVKTHTSRQRIKGQEVDITMTLNGAPYGNITDVRSFEINIELDLMSEGYMGETTERKDSIFKGVTGKMEMHVSHPDVLKLMDTLVSKAARSGKFAASKVNIFATLRMVSIGKSPKVQLLDVEFGAIPLNFASRSDYGTVSLDFACSNVNFTYS